MRTRSLSSSRTNGFETVATIPPSNYTGNILIHRTILTDQVWTNSTENTAAEKPQNFDDTSDPPFEDQNPHSGGSAGGDWRPHESTSRKRSLARCLLAQRA